MCLPFHRFYIDTLHIDFWHDVRINHIIEYNGHHCNNFRFIGIDFRNLWY